MLARHRELLVESRVHEVEVVAIAVQELDRALLEMGTWPLLARLERPLDRLAALDVAQLDATWAEPRPILMW